MDTRTTDQLAVSVRRQLRLGRLVPLGDAVDGTWITEQAAAGVLRAAGAGVTGVRPGAVRLSLADPDTAAPSAVPPPPSALPYGPLLLAADFEAVGDVPLPLLAERLRAALRTAARERLGLAVGRVDLRVTGLLEHAPDSGDGGNGGDGWDGPTPVVAGPGGGALEDAVAHAVSAAPGVAGLAPALGGGAARGVRVTRVPATGPRAAPALRVQVEIAAIPGRRALDAARAARAAVTDTVSRAASHTADGPAGPAAVTVLITAIRPTAAG